MGTKFSKFTDTVSRRFCSPNGASDNCNVPPEERNETGHDPAVHGARLEDRNYNNEGFKRKPCPPEQQQKEVAAAVTVQTQYRQHAAKEEVNEIKEEVAATKIQAGFRGYLDRETVRKMKSESGKKSRRSEAVSDERNSQESQPAEKLEIVNIDLADPEVEKAAMFIQSGFKGFKARKTTAIVLPEPEWELRDQQKHQESAHESHDVTESQDEGHDVTESQDEGHDVTESQDGMPDLGDPDVEKAAVKIQAGFKGLKARKELRKQKEEKSDLQDESEEVGESRETTGVAETDDVAYEAENPDEGIDEVDSRADHAAIKIQAGFRGYKTRKSLKHSGASSEPPEYRDDELEEDGPSVRDVEHGHDKVRPDPDQAATRIQASYKGYRTRKQLKSKTSVEKHASSDEVDAGDQEDGAATHRSQGHVNLDDPEVQKAVVKIQAGFKGMKARQEVKAKIAEKKSLTQSQESREFDEGGQVEEEEEIQGSSFIEVSQDEVGENEQVEMLADNDESEVQETDTLAADETQGDDTQRDQTDGDETQRDETEGDETQGGETQRDETEGDETQRDETQGDDTQEDEANEQPESLTEEM